MPELSIPHLEANARTLVSLVEQISSRFPREEREEVSDDLTHEILLKVWGGIPGFPRGGRDKPSPTDVNAGVVLAAVMQHSRRRIVLGL